MNDQKEKKRGNTLTRIFLAFVLIIGMVVPSLSILSSSRATSVSSTKTITISAPSSTSPTQTTSQSSQTVLESPTNP
jgi:hypothetical protein